jgi:hypothetical protein
MSRTADRQLNRFPAGLVVARGMLLVYLLLSATLNLHHNHGGPAGFGTPALAAEAHDHAPCPVDLFQSAHGPTIAVSLPMGFWQSHPAPPLSQSQPWPGEVHRLARPRAPPVLS